MRWKRIDLKQINGELHLRCVPVRFFNCPPAGRRNNRFELCPLVVPLNQAGRMTAKGRAGPAATIEGNGRFAFFGLSGRWSNIACGSANDPAAAGVVGIKEATMRTAIPPFVGFTKAPWNKDRLIGQKRPLKPREVWAIRVRLQLESGDVT